MATMTVEQSHIDYIHNQKQTVLDQLKEITGVEDENVIEQAIQASINEAGKFDMSQAVNILVDENVARYNQPNQQATPATTEQTNLAQVAIRPQGTSTEEEQPKNKQASESGGVIDLTNDGSEKEDLQRAIALSLQEQQHGMLGGQVTAEEQDISRVLEQSLAEAKAGTKRKRGEVWQDPLNPHERKRQHDWPVGLKNVGNTCWFSAVIQSLFHLPFFRNLVLNFIPPDLTNEISISYSVEHRNLLFMQELRFLFCLMVGTRRKYVDPSKAVDILKEAFQSGSSDSQQDVSEFTHKLLEWLEDAFKSDCSHPTSPSVLQPENVSREKNGNPMLDLFYGQFRSEGQNEGHVFSNEETFGQYPIQVNGFCNIHESLEAATAQEIETTNLETVTKSGQEHWFTKLPPVLLFELSRFQFNQQLGRPEKIHNKFDFPEVIYMDRYMEVNKNITKTKREEVRKLKERREDQQSKLEKYLNYGSGPKRVPLQDVLQYALEFVESKQDPPTCVTQDIDMASPCSNSSSMNVDSPCSSPIKGVGLDIATSNVARPLPATSDKPVAAASTSCPCPRHVSEMELKVLQGCLKRWRTEVESDVRELQDNIGVMDNAIGNMYSEASLQKVPYRLHAVLVHEGQAASGHYWAYVYNHIGRMWLKFNDITVAESSWDELQKESFGGYHNASAYCLMYIDCNKKMLISNPIDNETGQRSSGVGSLPLDLRQLVIEDNRRFQREIEQWDQEQLRKKEEAARQDTECQIVDERKMAPLPGQSPSAAAKEPLPVQHAQIPHSATVQGLVRVIDTFNCKGPEAALNEAMMSEMHRVQQLTNDTNYIQDHRLAHILVYVCLNNDDPPETLLRVILLEQIAYLRIEEAKGCTMAVKHLAKQQLQQLKQQPNFQELEKLYNQYHEDYSNFRKTVGCFISGFENYQKESYQEALPYFLNACIYNELLCKYGRKHYGLDKSLLCQFRRQCLLHLNDIAYTQFESDDVENSLNALKLMSDYVVPCMNLLGAPDASREDTETAEEIRGKWCSKLGEEITSQKQEHLQEFLGKLLDPSSELKVRGIVSIRLPSDADVHQFSTVMNKVCELGLMKVTSTGR